MGHPARQLDWEEDYAGPRLFLPGRVKPILRKRPKIYVPGGEEYSWPRNLIGVNPNITSADLTAQPTGTITVSTPVGTVTSDILVLVWADFEGVTTDTLSTPSGWTLLFNQATTNVRMWVYWAFGNVGNNASSLGFAFTHTGGADIGWVMAGFTNGNQVTPIDATGVGSTATAPSPDQITANAVTTVVNNSVELIACCDVNDGAYSAPGFTYVSNGSTLHQRVGLLYNLTPKQPPGSTGTVLCTNAASSTGQELSVTPFALRTGQPGTEPTVTTGTDTTQSTVLTVPGGQVVTMGGPYASQ